LSAYLLAYVPLPACLSAYLSVCPSVVYLSVCLLCAHHSCLSKCAVTLSAVIPEDDGRQCGGKCSDSAPAHALLRACARTGLTFRGAELAMLTQLRGPCCFACLRSSAGRTRTHARARTQTHTGAGLAIQQAHGLDARNCERSENAHPQAAYEGVPPSKRTLGSPVPSIHF